MIITTQQAASVTTKFKRELKSEDFVLISQENKQYKQIIKIMQEKEAIFNAKIIEMEKTILRLENQRDQYKTLCNQYSLKMHQYESIKSELTHQYKILKRQIERCFAQIAEKQVQVTQLLAGNEALQQNVVVLQQNAKTDKLVIQELRQHISKLDKQLIDKKIKIFSHLVDYKMKDQSASGKKQNQINKSNMHIANSQSFKTSANYQSSKNSKNNSNTNSISFSFVSNDSVPKRKESKSRNQHNKSIYI